MWVWWGHVRLEWIGLDMSPDGVGWCLWGHVGFDGLGQVVIEVQ